MTIRDNESLYNEALYEEICKVETELSQINHEHNVIVAKHKCEAYKLNELKKIYGDDTYDVKHKKLIIEKLWLSSRETVLKREVQQLRLIELQKTLSGTAAMNQKAP